MTTALIVYASLATALLLACALLIASMRHRNRARWRALDVDDCDDERFPELSARLALEPLYEGNDVALIHDAAYFDAFEAAVDDARASVHFETYLWKSDAAGERVAGALARAAERGVEVRLLLDAEGSSDLDEDQADALREAGVDLRRFRPPSWTTASVQYGRDHRKLLVVDGAVAIAGGHCVAVEWLDGADGEPRYRDISARIRGPVVAGLQAVFSKNWTEATGEVLADASYFPPLDRVGDAPVHLAHVAFDQRVSAVKTLHMLAIACARESITIQNPYFVPDESVIDALSDAAARGVRVRVMTPTAAANDHAMVVRAMRSIAHPLLEAGVELLLYDRSLLHQKCCVVDGRWAILGSTNFDFRSFEANEELSLSVFDEDLAAELTEAFERDAAHCAPLTIEDLADRGPWTRAQDHLFGALRRHL